MRRVLTLFFSNVCMLLANLRSRAFRVSEYFGASCLPFFQVLDCCDGLYTDKMYSCGQVIQYRTSSPNVECIGDAIFSFPELANVCGSITSAGHLLHSLLVLSLSPLLVPTLSVTDFSPFFIFRSHGFSTRTL